MRFDIVRSLAIVALVGGCTGKIQLNAGAAGPPLPAGSTMVFIGTNEAGGAIVAQTRNEVIAALERLGHAVSADAPARIEIGLTERPAATGVAVIDGADLSPAKRKTFLQSCRERTFRLMLTYYGADTTVPVTRAWAEERHCKGMIDASIGDLAGKAVAALVAGSSSETSTRPGID